MLFHFLVTPLLLMLWKEVEECCQGITEKKIFIPMKYLSFFGAFKKSYCPPTMPGHPHISTSVVHTKQLLSTLQPTVADVPLFPSRFPFAFKCHHSPRLRVCPSPWGWGWWGGGGVGGYAAHLQSLLLFLSVFRFTTHFLKGQAPTGP